MLPLLLMGCNKEVRFEQTTSALGDFPGGGSLDNDSPDSPDSLYEKVREGFVQSSDQPQVDIVFVVDNSASMEIEQKEMGERIGSFLGHFQGVDWQIGITTTDVSDGAFGLKGSLLALDANGNYILSPDTPNYEEVFRNNVLRQETIGCTTTCPSGHEEALGASLLAMEKQHSDNSGFFRDGAKLVFVYLTDEDELSDGLSPEATTPTEVLAAVSQHMGVQKSAKAYGIIIEPGDQACLDRNGNGNYGTFVAQLVQMTGGSTGSICDASYADSLSRIGADIERYLSAFRLDSAPVIHGPADFQVELRPAVAGANWELKGQSLEFSVQLPPGTEILVSYKRKKGNSGQ